MLKLYATQRLLASADNTTEVSAEFNTTRDRDLREIQVALRALKLIFSFGVHHLYHKSNASDVIDETRTTVDELNRLAHQLRVDAGILERQTFALKGKDGLILQRVNNSLRIFYSK